MGGRGWSSLGPPRNEHDPAYGAPRSAPIIDRDYIYVEFCLGRRSNRLRRLIAPAREWEGVNTKEKFAASKKRRREMSSGPRVCFRGTSCPYTPPLTLRLSPVRSVARAYTVRVLSGIQLDSRTEDRRSLSQCSSSFGPWTYCRACTLTAPPVTRVKRLFLFFFALLIPRGVYRIFANGRFFSKFLFPPPPFLDAIGGRTNAPGATIAWNVREILNTHTREEIRGKSP